MARDGEVALRAMSDALDDLTAPGPRTLRLVTGLHGPGDPWEGPADLHLAVASRGARRVLGTARLTGAPAWALHGGVLTALLGPVPVPVAEAGTADTAVLLAADPRCLRPLAACRCWVPVAAGPLDIRPERAVLPGDTVIASLSLYLAFG